MGPRVHVYTISWNEERILPHFLRHYSAVAERIVVYDNHSTDQTPDIVRAWPTAELRSLDTGDCYHENSLVDIKNSAYKESRGHADFVIVADTDEFLYHPDLRGALARFREQGITLPKITGYEMVAFRSPVHASSLVETVRLGYPNSSFDKRCVFDPEIDIHYGQGAHRANPTGPVVEDDVPTLKLLHYHYIGFRAVLQRNRIRSKRYSAETLKQNFGFQYKWGAFRLLAKFVHLRANAGNVITGKPTLLAKTIGPLTRFAKHLLWKPEYAVRD